MNDSKEGSPNILHNVYAGLQAKLSAGLSSSSITGHPVATGDSTEVNWLQMLQKHLPHRYQAEKVFIMDSQGCKSEQIDIAIYDRQYTPELYNENGQKLIPAEGVYAVLEVRPKLNKGNVEYAGGKVASVRKLHRTSAPITHAGGKYDPRPLTPILGGILVAASEWSPPFGPSFKDCLAERVPDEHLDIGCALDAGGFETIYDGKNLNIELSNKEHSLAFFFLRLLHRLQSIGTVPAIDYDSYLKAFRT